MRLHNIAVLDITTATEKMSYISCPARIQDRMVDFVKSEYPDKQYCVVEHWTWVDIKVNGEEKEILRSEGLIPSFIYADYMLQSSIPMSEKYVVSTLLVELVNNSIFVTKDTCYILLNQGTHTTTSLENALSLPLLCE